MVCKALIDEAETLFSRNIPFNVFHNGVEVFTTVKTEEQLTYLEYLKDLGYEEDEFVPSEQRGKSDHQCLTQMLKQHPNSTLRVIVSPAAGLIAIRVLNSGEKSAFTELCRRYGHPKTVYYILSGYLLYYLFCYNPEKFEAYAGKAVFTINDRIVVYPPQIESMTVEQHGSTLQNLEEWLCEPQGALLEAILALMEDKEIYQNGVQTTHDELKRIVAEKKIIGPFPRQSHFMRAALAKVKKALTHHQLAYQFQPRNRAGVSIAFYRSS